MMERVTLQITMTLLSDAIFGSGYSIPGGEDLAVCQDDAGYPYLKGSTLKGLLRESLENLAAWTGEGAETIPALLGEPGWEGQVADRRVQLSALTLQARPADANDCYRLRTFTKLQEGLVEPGTLRTASCICAGQVFSGTLSCAAQDAARLREALAAIKWVGTLRSRGFGRVRMAAEAVPEQGGRPDVGQGTCLHYRLRTVLPLAVTDLSRSHGNGYETRCYLPGSAVRGMVMEALASSRPEQFAAHQTALLSDRTRFLDAVPNPAGLAVLPSIKGFYEDKEGTRFESVVPEGNFSPGLKRASLGNFCALAGDTVRYWSARTDGVTRIVRGRNDDTKAWQMRYLSTGQIFDGYIVLDDPAMAPLVASAFSGTVWLGADRYAGCGQCEVLTVETVDELPWQTAYSCGSQAQAGTTLYLLAVSPLAMLDDRGDPCGLDTAQLADRLGVGQVTVRFCSTSLAEFGAFNRTWQCREPAVQMVDRGSLFRLDCDQAPSPAAIRQLERTGVGIRRAEGFGQVLFLRRDLLEGLTRKEALEPATEQTRSEAAALRRARYKWVMDHAGTVYAGGLSRSQLGTIQALCEKAMANGGDVDELREHLQKNLYDRGAKHGSRFRAISDLLQTVLETPLAETLGVQQCDDSMTARLELVCLLFDYSRRGGEKEGK
jgi:hypothetical protein